MAIFSRYSGALSVETGELYFKKYNKTLTNLQARQDLCDLVLTVGDKCISAHSLILIVSSDYFSALLGKPTNEYQRREITLDDVDGNAFEKLVNYCYTGCLELHGDTIEVLLTTANYLHFKEVVEGCCEYLLRHLQPSNCLGIGYLVEEMNIEAYLDNVKKFICEHFEEVSKQNDFFLINSKLLIEFIARDDLHVPSEEFVFEVLMKWIEFEPENRRKHFTELLTHVRLPMLPPTFLAEKVEPLCNAVENLKLVLNAQKSHLQLTSNSTQPRNCQSKSVVNQLLIIYIENMRLGFASYNLGTNKWTTWNTPPCNPNSFAFVMMDDQLIVVEHSVGNFRHPSGVKCLHKQVTLEQFSLRSERIGHEIAILNDSIYAIGGISLVCVAENSVERWDPTSQTWSFVAPMANGRSYTGVSVINDHLYVAGGRCHEKALTSVECYDPVENSWRPKAPMKIKRHSHCLAAYKGYLFAIGGNNNENSKYMPIERYDPRTDTWTSISCSLPIYGYTRCASFGPDLFIYNKSNFYMISSEGSCNKLELQIIPKPTILCFDDIKFFALPYGFNPLQKWIKNEF